MDLTHSKDFGMVALVMLSLLGGYLLLLQIREYFYEKPDPKLTYLTKAEHEAQISRLRANIDELMSITHANAAQIATLTAQTQLMLQRMSELTTKLDRLQEKYFS